MTNASPLIKDIVPNRNDYLPIQTEWRFDTYGDAHPDGGLAFHVTLVPATDKNHILYSGKFSTKDMERTLYTTDRPLHSKLVDALKGVDILLRNDLLLIPVDSLAVETEGSTEDTAPQEATDEKKETPRFSDYPNIKEEHLQLLHDEGKAYSTGDDFTKNVAFLNLKSFLMTQTEDLPYLNALTEALYDHLTPETRDDFLGQLLEDILSKMMGKLKP